MDIFDVTLKEKQREREFYSHEPKRQRENDEGWGGERLILHVNNIDSWLVSHARPIL